MMVEGVRSCSAMAHGGSGGNTFEILVFLLLSFSSLSSFHPSFCFLGVGKEVRRERQIV
jgi:hypothetical protein